MSCNVGRFPRAAIVLLASLAGGAAPTPASAAPPDVKSGAKPDAQLPYGSAIAPLRADRPAFDEDAYLQSKRLGQEQILDRVIAKAPPPVLGATPNYRYVRGRAVAMDLRADEIGVQLEQGAVPAQLTAEISKAELIVAAVQAARAAGLRVAPEGHRATKTGWAMLKLAAPLNGLAGASAAIEQLIKSPAVRVASPVFENPFVEGGYYMPTERVMVRAAPGLEINAIVKALAPDFEIANPALGKLEGAMTLRSTLRNGFAILRRANELRETQAFAWSVPAAIESMELHVFTPNDPEFGVQWAHRNTGLTFTNGSGVQFPGVVDRDMDTDQAWDITTGTSSIRVFVMDSGVQSSHPDLNFFDGRDFTTGAVNGVGTGQPGTCDDHGTAVAGCAAARINNNLGAAGTAGGCQVMSGKIGDQDTSPCSSSFAAYSSEWLVNALDWGRDNGARVTNASIGVGQNDAVEAMYSSTWTSGLLHFASAGNGGADSIGDNGSGFPGSAPFTISVSALDPNGTLTSFSNFGTNCDLCTGGIFIRSTDRTGSNGYTSNDLNYFSGTSAASPLAAGVGLLFFSQFPFATPSQARTAIFNSCTDLGSPGIDTLYNRGFINAFGALKENAPSNDDCSTPIIINPTGGNLVFHWIMDTTWATPSRLEPNESCVGSVNNSVFFRFTADHTGDVVIHTAGSAYDTMLAVFDGCPSYNATGQLLSSPTQLACNDDFNGTTQSQVSFHVEHGQTLLIKAAKFGATAGGGTLDFNLTFTPTPPDNDTCATAAVIADPETGAFSYNPPLLDTAFANSNTLCELASTCGSSVNPNGHSVFYRFVPAHDGAIDINTNGSNYDTVLSIHNACSTFNLSTGCSRTTQLACDDDGGSGLQSLIADFPVIAGRTYIIKAAAFGANAAGLLNFNFSYTPSIPANNNCGNATEIPGDIPANQFLNYNPPPQDIYYATAGSCDPDLSCIAGAENLFHSVWYSFRPGLSGTLQANTAGSNFDTALVIRTGCPTALLNPNGGIICIGAGQQVACSDNPNPINPPSGLLAAVSNVHLTGGQIYYIMLASKTQFTSNSGGTLDFALQYNPDPCPADFNADGVLNPDDLSDYIACFFSNGACAQADINGDGHIDPDDLSDYIAGYFGGC